MMRWRLLSLVFLVAMGSGLGPPASKGLRYVDQGNGTVKDTKTGLLWLKNANCFRRQTFREAICAAATLKHGECGLRDDSYEGQWRLPTQDEWHTMVNNACDPAISDDTETGCYSSGSSSFFGVQSDRYWSSVTYVENAVYAWDMYLVGGHVYHDVGLKEFGAYVWPVKDGD